MLLNLSINDLAVVKTLNLDVNTGMSVLTGETGAGKSILLTALGLALGDRADSGYIRPNSKRAEINLEFDLSDAPLAKKWLEENELDDDQHCLIRRVINHDGRSKAYINNRPVTLQTLQELSEKLVEIHGQHAHLTLLHSDEQRRLLDVFAGNQALLDQVDTHFHQWQQTHKELQALKKASADRTEREELLRYQLDELQQLDLNNFNYAELTEEHSKLAHLEEILATGHRQLDLLYENDEQSLNRLLLQSTHALNDLTRFAPDIESINGILNEAQIQIEEAAHQLRRYLDSLEADPLRLESLENQIGIIQSLCRKHHVQPEELPELAFGLEQELNNLTHSGERIEELTEKTERLLAAYHELAAQLTRKRQQGGQLLQERISAMIKELGMPQGDFIVQVSPLGATHPRADGQDKVEFLVSANPGLPAKPLSKVASGGELSRISLAIQVTTSHDKTTPTMIFDEVDSGIGGGIAEIVGQKLRALSLNRQVMCVTHLPQVASQAHHHLYVSKNNRSDITTSNVRPLAPEERVEEIARMLGGVNITENTLAHAREMLFQSISDTSSTL
ncbi:MULTISPECIES: DNA repair protein RecN [Methylotuvimicrobium]|uniref:DNA repair protein RecN n=2 Tax=Methylotuvimicrobium TaxID=2822410 RepID=G4T2C1_META2|nr:MULTISPECIES: DNA repair protein RecN [Methylotuvimicrobium]QCW82808.1 DNA repair protein RecN [Methylotuvimicrobium buryatense]CCE23561.1 DNA repair protein RecN (Recombination protein N) [Methylotuvimicrobium alcaliphilum 20Z]